MKNRKNRIIIPFSSLKNGNHEFTYKLDSTFFDQFDYSIIKDATIEIDVQFEKRMTFFKLAFKIKGSVNSVCDRCNDKLKMNIDGLEHLIVKFGIEDDAQPTEIKIIPENAFELDITEEIYELVHLQIPAKIEHNSIEDCDPLIIKKLTSLQNKEESPEADPRWSKLKELNEKRK
ncbi:MAG: hypothetical protein CMO34_01220 [Verrucomicrobia bacterium]|nr:hypothetical protein [Verrucomicrobiota bacterium]|tara:strand:- start:221 stop:745 length:525 start_codon:yes stop_codon:yes gene_type:complete